MQREENDQLEIATYWLDRGFVAIKWLGLIVLLTSVLLSICLHDAWIGIYIISAFLIVPEIAIFLLGFAERTIWVAFLWPLVNKLILVIFISILSSGLGISVYLHSWSYILSAFYLIFGVHSIGLYLSIFWNSFSLFDRR